MALLEIRKKNTDNIWTHSLNNGETIFLSKGHFRFVGNNFELTEPSGSDNIREVSVSDIKLYDETGSGSEEIFNTPISCLTRLRQLDYPYFPIKASVNDAPPSGFNSIIIEGETFLWHKRTANSLNIPQSNEVVSGYHQNYFYPALIYVSGDPTLFSSYRYNQRQRLY